MMSELQLNTTQEYKDIFIARLTEAGLSQEWAVEEYYATTESFGEEEGDPELDADEALTYYFD